MQRLPTTAVVVALSTHRRARAVLMTATLTQLASLWTDRASFSFSSQRRQIDCTPHGRRAARPAPRFFCTASRFIRAEEIRPAFTWLRLIVVPPF